MLKAVIVLCVLSIHPVWAQWSRKEGDPKPPVQQHYLVQPFTKAEWETSNFAKEQDLQWFRDAGYGMFIHFGLSTRINAELSWGTIKTRKAPDYGSGPVADDIWQGWAKELRFEKYNAEEWVEIARRAGFKYLVAIAKHCEGFHLWDTDQSEFKVTNTPFGRDYLKELADACHAAGMPFGIYYCQRDWYHPDYIPVDTAKVDRDRTWWTLHPGEPNPMGDRHSSYIDYQFKVIRELCSRFGKVDIFWWDAAWWGGMFTAEMWDAEKLTRMVRELQPRIIQNNRCSVPGDIDTPEQRLGFYQDFRPWESCISLTESWSYSGTPPKSRNQIIRMILHNICGDGNLLLSWGPQWNGEFANAEINRLFEVGAWLRENSRAVYGTRGGPWKLGDWGGAVRRGKSVYLHVLSWNGEVLRLPTIPDCKVKSARFLSGEVVLYKETDDILEINVPKNKQDSLDTIVELTMEKEVDGLNAIESGLVLSYDKMTFGRIVSRQATVTISSRGASDPGRPQMLVTAPPVDDFAFQTSTEASPWVRIDLGRESFVTAVRVLNRSGTGQKLRGTLRLSVSIDGKIWQEVWKTTDVKKTAWEITVMDYDAGAIIPGRRARYLHLGLDSLQPKSLQLRHIEVWGND
jgi:alpha-L-fucosidase